MYCRRQELKVSGAKRKANAHSSYYMHTSPYSFYEKNKQKFFFYLNDILYLCNYISK